MNFHLKFSVLLLAQLVTSGISISGIGTSLNVTNPPVMYPEQIAIVANFSKIAAAKAVAYMPLLTDIVGTADMIHAFNKTCPELLKLTARQVAQRLVDEVNVAELMHTFGASTNNQGDTNLASYAASDFFYNLWQIDFLKLPSTKRDQSSFDWNERVVFDMPPFKNGSLPSTWEGASKRLVYTMMNFAKESGPNNGFGDVTVIFNRAWARHRTLIAPIDTGMWYNWCNPTAVKKPVASGETCSAWHLNLGTLDALTHLFVYAYGLQKGNSTYAVNGEIYPKMACNKAARLTQIYGWRFPYGPYFEANIAANIYYPQGVHAVVASFENWFGTGIGSALRAWCTKYRWVLMWNFVKTATSRGLATASWSRLLDPVVFASTTISRSNYSFAANDTAAFSAVWTAVATARARNPTKFPIPAAHWPAWWNSLATGPCNHTAGGCVPSTLAVQPLSAYQCAQPDRCVGVSQKRFDCICYPPEEPPPLGPEVHPGPALPYGACDVAGLWDIVGLPPAAAQVQISTDGAWAWITCRGTCSGWANATAIVRENNDFDLQKVSGVHSGAVTADKTGPCNNISFPTFSWIRNKTKTVTHAVSE